MCRARCSHGPLLSRLNMRNRAAILASPAEAERLPHLQHFAALDLVSHALPDDLGRIDQVIEDGLVNLPGR